MQIDPSEYRYPLNKSITNLNLERSVCLCICKTQNVEDLLIGGLKQSKMPPQPSVWHPETSRHSLGEARHGDNRVTSKAPDKVILQDVGDIQCADT
jgi:hypothetical protein